MAKPSERAVTYPPHDCREILQTHYHNQSDATYSTCGVCGRITEFAWKRAAPAPEAVEEALQHDGLTYGELLSLTEGHGTSELYLRIKSALARRTGG